MAQEDIPDNVLRFIELHIDTVPHLEVLLLLWEDAVRLWSEQEVAQRIYVSGEASGLILAALVGRHSVKVAEGDPRRFSFNGEWEDAALVGDVADVYRRRVVQVANFIHSLGSQSVREFARAFDLKKDR